MPDIDPAGEAERIHLLERRSFIALAGQAMDELSAFYADDARLMLAHAPTVVGRKAIRVVFRNLASQLPRFQRDFRSDAIVVARSGDIAYVTGTYRFTPDSQHPEVFDAGKYLSIWKQEYGQWWIAVDMTSSDLSLPGTTAAPDQSRPGL